MDSERALLLGLVNWAGNGGGVGQLFAFFNSTVHALCGCLVVSVPLILNSVLCQSSHLSPHFSFSSSLAGLLQVVSPSKSSLFSLPAAENSNLSICEDTFSHSDNSLCQLCCSFCQLFHLFSSRSIAFSSAVCGGLFSFSSFVAGDYHQPLPTPPRLHQSTVL
uniref:Uncharacterized protein n=1 Tax=Salix viminalis TaxID=40686 RepID=A0A6N2MI80_SALVM